VSGRHRRTHRRRGAAASAQREDDVGFRVPDAVHVQKIPLSFVHDPLSPSEYQITLLRTSDQEFKG
jgi:hypothetical protein